MRYDWNRYGRPGTARFNRAAGCWLALLAVAACPLFLWGAVTQDWTLVFPALLIGGGATVQRLGMRKAYGVRARGPESHKSREEPQGGFGFVLPPGAVIALCRVDTGEGLRLPGTSMRDMTLGMTRLAAVLGPCPHYGAVPVDLLLTGERIAWLCPDCDAQLPAAWG